MSTIPILFLASLLIPLVSSLPLFILDRKLADIYLLINVFAVMSTYFLGAFLYVKDMSLIHVVLLKMNVVGEFYGLIIDPFSVIVGIAVVTCGAIFLIYSIDYLSPNNKLHPIHYGKGKFYAWMLLFLGSTLAFLHSSSLIQMIIFFELMTISCWGLILYYGSRKAIEAANKAIIYTHVRALLGPYIASCISFYYIHDTSLLEIHRLTPGIKLILFTLILVASLAKSAQFPFYSWLIDAMVASTPASAFHHGAAMSEMGVYLLGRIIQFINSLPEICFTILTIPIVITCIICVLMYPVQTDAKKLLAYSTVNEVMIMYVGLAYAIINPTIGLKASTSYLVTHAYLKGLGFLIVGVFGYVYGTHDMRNIKGLLLPTKLVTIG